ncbi:polysaccharide biosynthesis C-terminal domain-containing protein [Nocardioides sp. TF02-7]|uniref:lipopolysaccharide biosynthesis protein n=1 Tax=Nocardioides sp. TF02-7 TaxID=2917724 RepID=UPI001F06240D|nr:polysaccharide biosynthesis C-terminal domain-containing protein [Nocardioides sp. TF02-7]UMG91343.1 polysaccharide biosynthesis C-terminal domain-containing protein [Nocardioides sp. TF02-7]
MLLRGVRRHHPGLPLLARPDRRLVRKVAGFGLPRTVSAAAEQANLWLAVILVGALLDADAAGAYGSAARFVAAGMIVSTAARVAVAPRFSALLAAGDTAAVAHLYAVTARWVLLFGSPVYIALGVNAPTVLRWLGDGFDEAALSMLVLCLGSSVMLAAGNVQSLLLMSGGSGRAAVNRVLAVATMTVGTVLLVPWLGMVGAAVAWVVGTLLDVALAAVHVRRLTGISLDLLPVAAVAATVAGCVGGPCLLAVLVLGAGWPALLAGTAVAAGCLAAACWVGRRPLHVGELASVFRRTA